MRCALQQRWRLSESQGALCNQELVKDGSVDKHLPKSESTTQHIHILRFLSYTGQTKITQSLDSSGVTT